MHYTKEQLKTKISNQEQLLDFYIHKLKQGYLLWCMWKDDIRNLFDREYNKLECYRKQLKTVRFEVAVVA